MPPEMATPRSRGTATMKRDTEIEQKERKIEQEIRR